MSALAKIIRTKLLPWVTQHGQERYIVTHSAMRQQEMPDGVHLARRPIKGKKVAVRGGRIYKNSRHITARWPESGLLEVQKYKLMCVLSGAIDYPIANYSLQCGPGYFLFFPPGLPHSEGRSSYVDTAKSTFCETLSFLLHPNAVQYWITRWEQKSLQRPENAIILNQRIITLFRILMEEIYSAENPMPLAQETILTAFLSLMQREVETNRVSFVKENRPETLTSIPNLETNSGFRAELEQYIGLNINSPITIEDAARALYLSRAQFTRTVRRVTGMSFNHFLNAHRLREAKVLLEESQWTITFIAESLGFTSVNYFRTFFQKQTGMTPSEYRRQNISKF